MKRENVVKAQGLLRDIEETEKAIKELESFKPYAERSADRVLEDGLYNLRITLNPNTTNQISVWPSRAWGNVEIVETIKRMLKAQLDHMNSVLEALN